MKDTQLTNEDVLDALMDGYDIGWFDKRNYNDLGIDIMDLHCKEEINCWDANTPHYTETSFETIDYPTTDIHTLKNILVLDDTETVYADVRIQLVETDIAQLEEYVSSDEMVEWKVIDFKLHQTKLGE